jgi:hypothetical protein
MYSLDSSISKADADMKSYNVSGAIYMMLPMFKLYIHSDWFKYPRIFFISISPPAFSLTSVVYLTSDYLFESWFSLLLILLLVDVFASVGC